MSFASGKGKNSCKEIKKLSVEAFSPSRLSNEAQNLRSVCYKKGHPAANCLTASGVIMQHKNCESHVKLCQLFQGYESYTLIFIYTVKQGFAGLLA